MSLKQESAGTEFTPAVLPSSPSGASRAPGQGLGETVALGRLLRWCVLPLADPLLPLPRLEGEWQGSGSTSESPPVAPSPSDWGHCRGGDALLTTEAGSGLDVPPG